MSITNDLENTTFKRFAMLLIVVGTLLAIDSFFQLFVVYKLWPLLVLFLGTGFIGIFLKRKSRGALYLSVGEYLILFSFVALYCNFTSWRNLLFIWPVFIFALAIVFITHFFVYKKSRFVFFIGLSLMFLSIFFPLVFTLGSQSLWLVFIFLGLSILLSRNIK